MTQRSAVKKVVLVIAGATFTCALLSLGLAFWAWMSYGKHVYTGSLFATTFFFFTAAVVLYEMSRPRQTLPEEAEAAATMPPPANRD